MSLKPTLAIWRWIVGLSLTVTATAIAQTPTIDAIRRAHGPAPANLELRGVLQRTRDGANRETPFTLRIAGDRSRLETDGRVDIHAGVFGQSRRDDGQRSATRRTWEGLRDVYLTPFYALSELPLDQRAAGGGAVRFARAIQRKTHYGHQEMSGTVELDFDPATLLLAEARFGTVDGGQTPVTIRYSDYERARGAALPRRIERQVGDNPPQVFLVETVVLNARFSEAEFELEP